jgi:hypothetical protein
MKISFLLPPVEVLVRKADRMPFLVLLGGSGTEGAGPQNFERESVPDTLSANCFVDPLIEVSSNSGRHQIADL